MKKISLLYTASLTLILSAIIAVLYNREQIALFIVVILAALGAVAAFGAIFISIKNLNRKIEEFNVQRNAHCDNFDKAAIDLLTAVKVLTDLQKEQGEQYASLLNTTFSKVQEQYDVSQDILTVVNEQLKVSRDYYENIKMETINIFNDIKQAMIANLDSIDKCVKTATSKQTSQMQQYLKKAVMDNTKSFLNKISDILTSTMTHQREDLQTYFKNSISESKEPLFDEVSAMLSCIINAEIEELRKYLELYFNDISNDVGNIKTYSDKASSSLKEINSKYNNVCNAIDNLSEEINKKLSEMDTAVKENSTALQNTISEYKCIAEMDAEMIDKIIGG